MLIDDLIKILKDEKEKQEKFRDVFGEPIIGLWTDKGFVHDFGIVHTPDGVFALLMANDDDLQQAVGRVIDRLREKGDE